MGFGFDFDVRGAFTLDWSLLAIIWVCSIVRCYFPACAFFVCFVVIG